MIEVGDLLTAIIIEDQGNFTDVSTELLHSSGTPVGHQSQHPPFVLAETATRLLETIQHSLPRSQEIPTSRDMPISPSLGQILTAANDLKEALHSKAMTPLHLLAAVRQSTEDDALFRDSGFMREQILEAIRREDES